MLNSVTQQQIIIFFFIYFSEKKNKVWLLLWIVCIGYSLTCLLLFQSSSLSWKGNAICWGTGILMRHQFKLKENGTSMTMETYGLVYRKNCTMPVMLKIYSEKPCGLKDLKLGGRTGVMSMMLFCHSSYIANCGQWFGWVTWAAAGLGRCKGWLGPAVCLHACSLAQIFAIAFRGLLSEMCGGWGVAAWSPLVTVADVWPGPRVWSCPDLSYCGWWASVGTV